MIDIQARNIFITGGSGTLGKALIRLLGKRNQITIYSRDVMKQHAVKQLFPDVRCILGDVADYEQLRRAIVGHDTVIHAAAFKHIPEGEVDSSTMMMTNIIGSKNVADACYGSGVDQVVGISTDKACYPVNAYGASKMMMERLFAEHGRNEAGIHFNCVRYGNVIGSTGSVLNVWKKMLERDGHVTATNADMTRYFMTVVDAANLVAECLFLSLTEGLNSSVVVPRAKALRMREFAEYTMPDAEFFYEGLRMGEKMNEVLVTSEEWVRSMEDHNFGHIIIDDPMYSKVYGKNVISIKPPFNSDNAERLTKDELLAMLAVPL